MLFQIAKHVGREVKQVPFLTLCDQALESAIVGDKIIELDSFVLSKQNLNQIYRFTVNQWQLLPLCDVQHHFFEISLRNYAMKNAYYQRVLIWQNFAI